MDDELPRPGKSPCPTCPYRRDVPAGIWDASEYKKLPAYDGEITEQALNGATRLFLCHQQDCHLCAGWVACHDMHHSLAVRLHGVHPDTFAFTSPVPVFASGAQAAAHGLSGVDDPGIAAQKAIEKLTRKQQRSTSSRQHLDADERSD